MKPENALTVPLRGLPVQTGGTTTRTSRTGNPDGTAFSDLLKVRQGLVEGGTSAKTEAVTSPGGVKFSAHAQTRLQSRQISLQASHLDRLDGAVQRAQSKGSRDALVLMDDLAMVVSVLNKTVVTVVDRDNLKGNVFTNIDSAVIA
ncbi:MAG: flagellar protein [Chthonomonadaceae bacterium]|nr:flagellar protein [Chthonomonadaceae bacterium]